MLPDARLASRIGAQPNPQDPVYLNNRDRDLRDSHGVVNGTWEPKHWVQEMDASVEVSCNKCLAAMRACESRNSNAPGSGLSGLPGDTSHQT